MKCIDLKQWESRYRVTKDCNCEPQDEWSYEIRGTYGTIYPHSSTMLAVECDYKRAVQRKLESLGLKIHQDGDREKTYLFTPEQMEEVATLIKAYKAYKVSNETLQKMKERGRQLGEMRQRSLKESQSILDAKTKKNV